MSRIIPPRDIKDEQQAQIDKYIAQSGVPGVLVGAIIGDNLWNVKPLIVNQGALYLLRFSYPGIHSHKKHANAFKQTIESFLNSPRSSYLVLSGHNNDDVWFLRNFYQLTLEDIKKPEDEFSSKDRIQLVRNLIVLVKDNFDTNLIHGHIAPSNLTFDNLNPILLDYCTSSFVPELFEQVKTLAPEIRKGAIPKESTDIYGLALVIQKLASDLLTKTQLTFLNVMLLDNPFKRPGIDEVVEVFNQDFIPIEEEIVEEEPEIVGELKTGKVLERDKVNIQAAPVKPKVKVQAPKVEKAKK